MNADIKGREFAVDVCLKMYQELLEDVSQPAGREIKERDEHQGPVPNRVHFTEVYQSVKDIIKSVCHH